MKTVLLLTLALVSAPSFASTLTCNLQSGKAGSAVSVDLANIPSEYPQSEWVNDVSILLDTSCEAASCSTEITFLSQKLEDEAGNDSFEFNASAQGVVYDKPVKSAPDHRAYRLTCEVK